MAAKYQVFVSSTYNDLVQERQAVSRAILDMGHIPAGMEMFPAADVQQLTYIKKIIDECDYYILIVGARYGSLDSDGISYTEREYEYAVDTGKTVLAFIHADVDQVPLGKTDKDDGKREKLFRFMATVSSNRLVQHWKNPEELAAKAILALTRAFTDNPQIGWVRADTIPDKSTMADVLRYREMVDQLTLELDNFKQQTSPSYIDAADLSAKLKINYTYLSNHGKSSGSRELSYLDILRILAPKLHTPATLYGAKAAMEQGLHERYGAPERLLKVPEAVAQDALLHLVATGHVKMWAGTTKEGVGSTGYQITEAGKKIWLEASYVKKA